jgi:hypothetical protein
MPQKKNSKFEKNLIFGKFRAKKKNVEKKSGKRSVGERVRAGKNLIFGKIWKCRKNLKFQKIGNLKKLEI